jgi:hypothetical protein
MEMREKIEISGEGNGTITLIVEDADDIVTMSAGTEPDVSDHPMNLAEARRLRNALTLAIMVAEHNVTDFDS